MSSLIKKKKIIIKQKPALWRPWGGLFVAVIWHLALHVAAVKSNKIYTRGCPRKQWTHKDENRRYEGNATVPTRSPSRHSTLTQRRFNVDSVSQRWNNVDSTITLKQRWIDVVSTLCVRLKLFRDTERREMVQTISKQNSRFRRLSARLL